MLSRLNQMLWGIVNELLIRSELSSELLVLVNMDESYLAIVWGKETIKSVSNITALLLLTGIVKADWTPLQKYLLQGEKSSDIITILSAVPSLQANNTVYINVSLSGISSQEKGS